MKIRTDFVSNSSSCSFVVRDPERGISELKKLGLIELPDFDEIEVKFELSEDDFSKHGFPSIVDWRCKDEEVVYCKCAFNKLDSLPEAMLPLIKNLRMECDDYDQKSVFLLEMMYETLRSSGISVTNDFSERNFPGLGSGSAMMKMFMHIADNLKANGGKDAENEDQK